MHYVVFLFIYILYQGTFFSVYFTKEQLLSIRRQHNFFFLNINMVLFFDIPLLELCD